MIAPRKSVIAALTMGVLIVLGTLRIVDLYGRRAEVLRTSSLRAANLASILSEYLRDNFSAADAALRQLAAHSQRIGGPGAPDADWAPSLASARAGLTGAGAISVADAQGVIRHSNQPAIVGQSRRGQYLFRRLSTEPTDAFLVDTPFKAIVGPSEFLIPIGRRLTNKDGAFDGIIVMTLTPAALRSFFRTIDVGARGAVWVLHPDGLVLFREPSEADPIGQSSRANPIFQAARQGPAAGVLDAPVAPGGPAMLSAFHVTSTPPLIVAVSLDRGELLADWRRQVVAMAIAFPVLLATMAATLAVLFRQMDERTAAQQQLIALQAAEALRLKDANERLGAALEIEQGAHRETEAAARLKDEFVMTVSHELRTPLTSISGWVQLLESGRLSESQAQGAIATIARSANVQARLVDDLLDVSRIISGKLRLEVLDVDVAQVMHEAAVTVQPAATAKSVRLDLAIDPSAGTIAADPDRLQQIVWNLLSNAIKFTPAGGRVVMSLQRSAHSVDVVVRDSGAGIAADFLPHVFERFRQADGSAQRRHGGLGLGLAIVRHLVELHGGTVSAESAGPDQGATFRVTLPIHAAAPVALS